MAPEANQLTALEREFLPPALEIVETPASPLHGPVIWTTLVFVVAMIAWATLGRVDVVAMAPGKFIPDGRVKELQPLESAIVKAIHVKEGQRVTQGELLLELDPTLSAAELTANQDKYGFNQLEQQRLNRELNLPEAFPTLASPGAAHSPADASATPPLSSRQALQDRIRQARAEAYASKLAQARETVVEKTAALDAALATLDKYRESVAIDTVRESAAAPLADSGAISRDDYLQIKQTWIKDRDDLIAQAKTVQQAQAAMAEAEHGVAQVERDHKADIYKDLDQQVTQEPALKGDLDKARQLYDLKWLRAPVSGTVQSVSVTTLGQVVTAAQSLVSIVPDGTPLIIEATVTNEDIGYLKVGQPVDIKVDTFPFQKFGTLKGTLVWISPDAEDKSAASKDPDTRSGAPQRDPSALAVDQRQGAGYVYRVHIRADATTIKDGNESRALQAGMTVQADIVTDRRRVISFLLAPIVKYLDEGLTVR